MKPRYLFLVLAVLICAASILLIMVKGKPQDRVSLDSVAEIGEGLIHSVHKVGGILTTISDEDEMKIGDGIAAKAATSFMNKELDDSSLGRYVNDVGGRLTEYVKRKNIKYKFHIIEAWYPNAYASPGGHIYITTGLLMLLRSESELASILAHEITHVDAKHSIGTIQYKVKTEKVLGSDLGTFIDIGCLLFLRPGYSEVQETEADVASAYILYKAGYHPLAMKHAFDRIAKYESSREYKDRSATPVEDTVKAVGGLVYRYFGSHPSALDRIAKIEKYITENKLAAASDTYYIGQKNYEQNISYGKKRFKDEFKKDYVIVDPEKKPERPVSSSVRPEPEEKLLDEVYTIHGIVRRGMTVDEVEKILPKISQAFKYDMRMGYKNIIFKDKKNNIENETAGLWIELRFGMVKGMKIIKSQ